MEDIAWMFQAYELSPSLPEANPLLLLEVAELAAQAKGTSLEEELKRIKNPSLGNYRKEFQGIIRLAARITGFSEVIYFGAPTHGLDADRFVAVYTTNRELDHSIFWEKFKEIRGPLTEADFE